MKKAAIYYRVSTGKQDFESQEAAINAWLEKQTTIKKYRVFKDVMSGKSIERPRFKSMIKQAREGKFDVIVVFKLDRFSRNTSHAIRTLLDLDDFGVDFISVTQPMFNQPAFRKTMLMLFAELAQMERETTVERIKWGLQAAKQRGVRLGRPPKVTDAIEAKIISLHETGLSTRKIARKVKLAHSCVWKVIKNSHELCEAG